MYTVTNNRLRQHFGNVQSNIRHRIIGQTQQTIEETGFEEFKLYHVFRNLNKGQ